MRRLGKKRLHEEHLNGAVCLGEIRKKGRGTTGLLFRKGRRFFGLFFLEPPMKVETWFFKELNESDIVRMVNKNMKVFKKIAGEHYLEETRRGVFKEVRV